MNTVTPPRSLRCARRALLVLCVCAWGCLQPPPDVGGLVSVRQEDTRVVVLLREADRLMESDPHAAARMIRETALVRARANATAASALRPRHPRAEALADRLARLLDERVVRLERYADALDTNDPATLLREVRAQRALEDDLLRLETRLDAAAHEPATRGCAGPAR